MPPQDPPVQNTNDPVDHDATDSEEYERLDHAQLKALCKKKGFASTGSRDIIIQRLHGHASRLANTQHQPARGLPPDQPARDLPPDQPARGLPPGQPARGLPPAAVTRARVGLFAISDTALLVCGAFVFFAAVGQLGWMLLKDHLSYENVITILEWRRTLFWWTPLVLGVTLAVGKFFLFPSRSGIFKFSPLYLLVSFLDIVLVFSVANDPGVRPDHPEPTAPGEEVDPTITLSLLDSGETLPESIPLPPSPIGSDDGNDDAMEILPLDSRWINTELCRGLDTLKDNVGWKIRERHDSDTSLLPPSLPPTPGLFSKIPKRFLICRALSEASLKEQAVQDRDIYSDSCHHLYQEVCGLKGQETEIQGLNRQNEAFRGMVRRATRDLFLARGSVWTILRFRGRTDADGEEPDLRYTWDHRTMTIEMNHSKRFLFDDILAAPVSNRAVFERVEPLTQATLEGFNLCIIADGQSGSGKSYTLTNGPHPITTSAVESLFAEVRGGSSRDYKVLVTCSILEVYKDRARDLLSDATVTVSRVTSEAVGCSSHPLYAADNLAALMRKACAQRTNRPTGQNQHSSRGDLVIIITITQDYLPEVRNIVSKLVFVDLAGSESLSSSPEDAEEAKGIKKGRDCLQRMIMAYQETRQLFPDSELTLLLRRYFLGLSKVVLLATASPLEKDRQATLATLEFADRIRNGEAKPAKRRPRPT